MKQEILEAGMIRNTHALRGEVKAECWLDGDRPFRKGMHLYLSVKRDTPLEILSVRRQGDVFLLGFSGIDSVEQATLLKGKTLYAAREEIDPRGDKIFFADLIGTPLREENGRVYGTVSQVTSRGGGELLVIRTPEQKEYYFPMVREWIVSMDPDTGIVVHAPEGLFD